MTNDTWVVCRHGGEDSFNIPAAHKSVLKSISRWPPSRLQYIFMGTKKFMGITESGSSSDSIHFVEGTANMNDKEEYFSACDVMLHARADKHLV
jgi:hypothetical protein